MAKCIKCEKTLLFEFEGDNDDNTNPIACAGFIEVSFHYGSRHDQCKGWHDKAISRLDESTPLKKILTSDRIQGYICDECFEDNLELFEGWDITTETIQKKII